MKPSIVKITNAPHPPSTPLLTPARPAGRFECDSHDTKFRTKRPVIMRKGLTYRSGGAMVVVYLHECAKDGYRQVLVGFRVRITKGSRYSMTCTTSGDV